MGSANAYKTSGVSDFNLWHRRMGHPSSKVLKLISAANKFSKNSDNLSCDVCFKAKQTREMFYSSDNKAKNCFDLIHCDL